MFADSELANRKGITMICPHCGDLTGKPEAILQGSDRQIGIVYNGKTRKVPVIIVTCFDCRKIITILPGEAMFSG